MKTATVRHILILAKLLVARALEYLEANHEGLHWGVFYVILILFWNFAFRLYDSRIGKEEITLADIDPVLYVWDVLVEFG